MVATFGPSLGPGIGDTQNGTTLRPYCVKQYSRSRTILQTYIATIATNNGACHHRPDTRIFREDRLLQTGGSIHNEGQKRCLRPLESHFMH